MAVDINLKEELPQLKSMLTQTISKMDKWTGDEKQNIICEHFAEQEQMESRIRELREKSSHLQALRHELTLLTRTVDGHLREKELMGQELDLTQSSLTKEHKLMTGQEKVLENEMKELNHAVELFRDRMGLTFKKTSGNRLQMVFTNIDHKEPASPFYFFVRVEGGQYYITDCEPAIPDLDDLVEKLNQTNNLRSFVVAVRKRFKQLVDSK